MLFSLEIMMYLTPMPPKTPKIGAFFIELAHGVSFFYS